MSQSMVQFQVRRRYELAHLPRDRATASETKGIGSRGNTAHFNLGKKIELPSYPAVAIPVHPEPAPITAAHGFQDNHRAVRERLGMGGTANSAVVPRSRVPALPTPIPVEYVRELLQPAPVQVQANWQAAASVTAQPHSEDPANVTTKVGVINSRWREIVREVCQKHKVTILEIRSPYRDRRIVAARHEIFYRLRHETTFGFPEIGRRVGLFDHSTVMKGIARHEQRIKEGTAL